MDNHTDNNIELQSQTNRNKCRILRATRKRIADQYGIDLMQEECTYDGPCTGTCPKCQEEELVLNELLLEKRQSKPIANFGPTYEPPKVVEPRSGIMLSGIPAPRSSFNDDFPNFVQKEETKKSWWEMVRDKMGKR